MKKYINAFIIAICAFTHTPIGLFATSTPVYYEVSEKATPYLIPDDHPMKPALDFIFSKPGVLADANSFRIAGFKILLTKRAGHTRSAFFRLASHPLVPGYLFKVYLDSEKGLKKDEALTKLTARCEGAANIRRLIQEKGIRHFSVPDKWLYRVPLDLDAKHRQQPVILMVTDMQLANKAARSAAWKRASKSQLDELYCILSHGYASTFLPGNMPYTLTGKFACVDTEIPKRDHVNLEKVNRFLPSELRPYWNHLLKR